MTGTADSPNSSIGLTEDFLSYTSVSPDRSELQSKIAQRLEVLGFRSLSLEAAGAFNLFCRLGDKSPLLVFAGHSDVVPPGDESKWTTPPFKPAMRDGRIFGRGACDMKGGLAAMVTALEIFAAKNNSLPFSLGLIVAGDEETTGEGTKAVLEKLKSEGTQVTFALVGEPTSLTALGDSLKVGRRGSVSYIIKFYGTQGHTAFPHNAMNSISNALDVLKELAEYVWDKGGNGFDPSHLEITNFRSGVGAHNVIPGEAEVWVNVRFSPVHTPDSIKSQIEKVVRRTGLRFEISQADEAPSLPFLTTPGKFLGLVEDAVAEITGKAPQRSTSGGTSDARFFAAHGAQVVELGLKNRTIHAINEHTETEDLVQLTRIYLKIIESFAKNTKI